MSKHWVAERMSRIEGSGIRKIFELARTIPDPVNLSIGQPHFPVPRPIKDALHSAVERDQNGYTITQGIPTLRERLQKEVNQRLPGQSRDVVVTSGTSGGLFLALMSCINPGEEVILFDPYFVSYPHLVTLTGGVARIVNTYPTFQIDVNRVREAITPKTKAILFSSPSNPTGVCLSEQTLRDLAALAKEKNLLLISDEIYRNFWYDGPFRSVSEFHPETLVVDGFGKTYGITGWRLGFAHGPSEIISEMAKLQQFTFVCAPSIVQEAAIAACDFDTSEIVRDYREKRDRIVQGLKDRYEFVTPGGAFYLFPRSPRGSATEFVTEAISQSLLIIPGVAFGPNDSHFRVSFATDDRTLERGIEILNRLAKR
jgi:aspartate aminotransferase/aminotransferase